jgi:hypothetical protein
MWLLSQNGKSLVNANSIWVEGNALLAEYNSGVNSWFTMGTFEDTEEALRALAEIASAIGGGCKIYRIRKKYNKEE